MATAADNRPTKKQRELLSFIDGFIKGHGYGPSYREVMRALNYKSVSTVAIHIDNLIAKGYLEKKDNSARSVVVRAATSTFQSKATVTKTEQKWLIDAVAVRFAEAEKAEKLSERERDNLFVLVGALHILGLDDAAESFKPRLKNIKTKR